MRRGMVAAAMVMSMLAVGACSTGGSDDNAQQRPEAKTAAEQKAAAEARTNSAIAARCQTDLRTVQTAIQAYRAVHDEAPSSMADLVGDMLSEAPEEWDLGPVGPDGLPTVVPTEAGVAAGCVAEG